MQPHSEVPTTTTKASATTTNNSLPPKTTTTATTTVKDNNKINNQQSPSSCKLVKSCRPLVNFNFYLDINDHQISKKVEERITELGGNLEFFLTKSVTHFITDRSLPVAATSASSSNNHNNNNNNNSNKHCVNNSPSTGVGVNGGGVGGGGGGGGVYPITPSPYLQSPQTPTTPKTPYTNQVYSGDSGTDGVVVGGTSHQRIKGATSNNNNNTPNSKKKITRADAMLHRALQSQQNPSQHYSSVNQYQQQQQQQQPAVEEHHNKRPNLEYGAYKIWTIEYAIKFLKRVTADVKLYSKKFAHQQSATTAAAKGACEPIQLKGHFIKIEAISGSNRPYYSVFRNIEWPKIQLAAEGAAFRLTAAPTKRDQLKSAKDKPPSKTNAMTRKSRSSSKHNPNHMRLKAKQAPAVKQTCEKPALIVDNNSSEKQCGVCEICKIEYDTLTIHLKTKDHEFFARNQNNYLALDSLIKSSASVDKFLEDTAKDVDAKDESSVEPMEIDEESSRSTRKSSRRQSPAPEQPAAVIKIKTKLKEVEAMGEKKPPHNNGRKPAKSNNVLLDSPPIRHPLPTSTIYKVVADSKAQTDPVSPKKSSIIVKFRKIRQTELSILNGEAENFMFPRRPTSSDRATDSDRQTSTDSNRVSSSSISSESHLTEETPALVHDRPDTATTTTPITPSAKRRRTTTAADNVVSKSNLSVCYQSFPNAPIQPNKTPASTAASKEDHPDSKPLASTRRRRRTCVGRRRRRRCVSTNPRNRSMPQRWASEDRMGEDGNTEEDEEEEEAQVKDVESDDSPQKSPGKKIVAKIPAIDLNQGRIKDQIYAFERLPVKELWYEVFRRQDACTSRMFEYWGSTSYRKLPYEIGAMPMRTLSNCKICTPYQMAEVKHDPQPATKRLGKLKKIKKERKSKSNTPEPPATTSRAPKISSRAHNKHLNKATFLSCDLMPRKSPREHASTLAILSCLIKQRKDSEIDEQAPPTPRSQSKEKTPEKRCTPSPSPVTFVPRNDTPEPLQFVSEISENVKRLRRGQKKFDDFLPTATPLSPNSKKRKPAKPKGTGLEFEIDEKRLKSLEAKQKSAVQLEHEIDAYLGRMSMRALRYTPTLPSLSTLPVQESSSSSGFVDDFTSEVDLIDLIDCYDGGGPKNGPNNEICNPLRRRPSNVYNLFSAHNRKRKNNKTNRTGWPTTRRRNTISTRQSHLLQKPERFRFFCDYQTRQQTHSQSITTAALQDGLAPPTTATSMTPPDTDLDEKDDCTRSSMPDDPDDGEEEEETSIICKDDLLNNSCMSPSEKADNSDIFTVSSDGLDTDLDISCNQIIKTEDIDDECTTSSTLAALPPPPPPPPPQPEFIVKKKSPQKTKSPKLTQAMRSIIKREVKVTCKRLRTPFRRFRQRR